MAATKKKTAKAASSKVEPAVAASEETIQEDTAKFETATVSCEGYVALNVRPEPKFGGKTLRTLNNGEKVEAAPAVDGWRELKYGGFVKAEFLV